MSAFTKGQRVIWVSKNGRGEPRPGVITAIDDLGTITVKFDNEKGRGVFDRRWFEVAGATIIPEEGC